MNRILKSSLLVLMVIAMMTSMLACGGSGTAIPTGAGNQQGGTQQGGNTDVDPGDVTVGTVTYPIDTDVSLSIWCPSTTSPIYKTYRSYTQSPWHAELVNRTGVEIEWKHPVAGANDQQAYHLLMIDEELPNIISYGINPGEAQLLINEGAIIDLKPYLAQYAPDYWKFITAPGNEEYLRSVTTEEGQIYTFRNFSEDDSVAYGPIVRKDWLDACGLDIPVTIEDWEEMLIAFRDRYGAKFAFPYSRFSSGGFGAAFGAFTGLSSNTYLDNGVIKYANVQPEFKEYLGTLARWVQEGLLDVDSLTMTDEGFRTKALNGNTGAGFVVMSLFTKTLSDAAAERTNAEWIAVPYPVQEEGQKACWTAWGNKIYNNGCVISTSNTEEEIITAVKWLNYFYCEEGIMYTNFGIEGETYEIDENGVPYYTDLVMKDRDGPSAGAAKYTGCGNVPHCGFQLSQTAVAKNEPIVAEGSAMWRANADTGQHVIPTLVLTAEEAARQADLNMAYATYCNEVVMKIVAGQMSIDEWDGCVDYIYQLGLEESLEIMNAAYQRYLQQVG